MLIRFSVRNYKVFRERAELSLIASNYDKDTNEDNVFEVPAFGLRLLKSAVVYGANASGKSKLIEALAFMREFVDESFTDSQKGDEIKVVPFRLDTVSENEPSEFETVFIHQDVLYRYGFQVNTKAVVAEWLYHRPHTKEIELFYRDGQRIDQHRRSFSASVNQYIKDNSLRENALLVSALANMFNDPIAGKVLAWFQQIDMPPVIWQERLYLEHTSKKLNEPAFRKKMLRLLQVADLGIQNVVLAEETKGLWGSIGRLFVTDIQTTHPKYDSSNQVIDSVNFKLEADESQGTQRFFALTGPLLDSLEKGSVFVADELDTKLHPNLVSAIIQLFHSPVTNPRNAQLIFNTHNTNLLSADTFRRDQVWFTEKDWYGAATLFSLSDFKPRSTENFERNYVEGRYGAVPYLNGFAQLSNETNQLEHAGTKE